LRHDSPSIGRHPDRVQDYAHVENVPCSGIHGTNLAQGHWVKTVSREARVKTVALRGTRPENVDDSGVEEAITIVSRLMMGWVTGAWRPPCSSWHAGMRLGTPIRPLPTARYHMLLCTCTPSVSGHAGGTWAGRESRRNMKTRYYWWLHSTTEEDMTARGR
jgi:hypothetical protein